MYRCRQLVSQCSTTIKSNLGHGRQRFVGESTTKRFGSDHGYNPPAIKPATLNEMPTPKGSWASEHSRVQAKYNMHLAAGLGFTAFTLFVGYQSGSFYLNFGPELNTKVNVLSHEQVRKQAAEAAATAAAVATIVEEPVPEPEVVAAPAVVEIVEEAVPVAVVEEAAPVAEVASIIVEEVAPASVPESVEAVPAPSGNESGPSDQSEGEVQSDPTVSVALTVEVVAETVTDGSSPVTESQS